MKKSFLLLCYLFLSINIVAQSVKADVIIKKDNMKIEAIIQEINSTTIKYKRFSNQTGPIFTIEKSKVASVLYANGEVESFENTSPNRDIQVAESVVPGNSFEKRIRRENDIELKKMYALEKNYVKNRRVQGSICLGLSGVGLITAMIANQSGPSTNPYSAITSEDVFQLGVIGAIGFGVSGALTFINMGKHKSRMKAIEQEFLRRNIKSDSFSFKIQPSYNPLLHAPTITLRASF